MLLAEAVGQPGHVLAIDREVRAVETAHSRAEVAGYCNIETVLATYDNIPIARPFDACVGRYVLVHQSDPVAMIRKAASVVRPAGDSTFLIPQWLALTYCSMPPHYYAARARTRLCR